MTNVMVATPHNRLEKETLQALFLQTYSGSLDHHFTCHNPNPVPGMNIIAAYIRLRAVFLAEPAYTHLWIVENDLIPPPDALDKLLAAGADIAYAVYCFRRGKPTVNIMQPASRNPMVELGGEWARAFRAGAVVDCGGLGFGCTLIARHVIERFEMRSEGGGGDADTCLANDATKAGLVQRAHLGVVCGHKRPDGVVIWPQATRPFYKLVGVSAPKFSTVRAVHGFAVWGENGAPMIVPQGQAAPIDFEVAQSLVAAGQAEYVGEPPKGALYKDIQ